MKPFSRESRLAAADVTAMTAEPGAAAGASQALTQHLHLRKAAVHRVLLTPCLAPGVQKLEFYFRNHLTKAFSLLFQHPQLHLHATPVFRN